jgi:PAS domain S-box-containing protein
MNDATDPRRLLEAEAVREAQDLQRAIAGGEVDAFVVGTSDENKRVLLLAGAYQRYRQVVERMHQGALTVSQYGDILYANQRFADMLGLPLSALYAARLDAFLPVADRAMLGSFLLLSSRNSRTEVEFVRRDGSSLPVRLSLASFADGYSTILVTDLSELRRLLKAEDSLRAIRQALDTLQGAGLDAAGKQALQTLGAEAAALARLVTELREGNPTG